MKVSVFWFERSGKIEIELSTQQNGIQMFTSFMQISIKKLFKYHNNGWVCCNVDSFVNPSDVAIIAFGEINISNNS